MALCFLKSHPDTPTTAIQSIEAGIDVDIGMTSVLRCEFRVTGDGNRLVLPGPQLTSRKDELWRSTCCEIFIRVAGAASYFEFNFSPSTAWAAYSFNAYRADRQNLAVSAPQIATTKSVHEFKLAALVDLKGILPLKGAMQLAVSCVIEEEGGSLSYWALQHPAGKPDFHHPGNFTLQLAS